MVAGGLDEGAGLGEVGAGGKAVVLGEGEAGVAQVGVGLVEAEAAAGGDGEGFVEVAAGVGECADMEVEVGAGEEAEGDLILQSRASKSLNSLWNMGLGFVELTGSTTLSSEQMRATKGAASWQNVDAGIYHFDLAVNPPDKPHCSLTGSVNVTL